MRFPGIGRYDRVSVGCVAFSDVVKGMSVIQFVGFGHISTIATH